MDFTGGERVLRTEVFWAKSMVDCIIMLQSAIELWKTPGLSCDYYRDVAENMAYIAEIAARAVHRVFPELGEEQ